MSFTKFIPSRKNLQSALCVFFVTCFALTHAFCQQNLQPDEKAISHLKKFTAAYEAGLIDNKPELTQEYYAEDIRLMPEFQKTVIGATNALLYYKAFTNKFDVLEINREEKEILDLGSIITEIGMFRMKIRLKSTAKDYEINGKYFDIWERSKAGKLAIITNAWNYSHYMEIEDQLRFNEVPIVDVALQAHVPVNSNISFELAALNRLMENIVSQHDAKIWSQFYTDDGMFLYSRNPVYEGKDVLNKFLEAHAKELPVFEKLDIRNDRIDNRGDYVVEYASHIANWRNGESSGINTGKDLRIWRREKDGSLKIFRHIGMYD